MKRYSLAIIILFFLIAGCKEQMIFRRIKAGNFEDVQRGFYYGETRFIGPGTEYNKLVKKLQMEIERHQDILPKITRKFFMVPQQLNYKFKYACIDDEKGYLILRYFARIFEHPIYAGYQIQLVFDIDTKRLVRIFTNGVPLE